MKTESDAEDQSDEQEAPPAKKAKKKPTQSAKVNLHQLFMGNGLNHLHISVF